MRVHLIYLLTDIHKHFSLLISHIKKPKEGTKILYKAVSRSVAIRPGLEILSKIETYRRGRKYG